MVCREESQGKESGFRAHSPEVRTEKRSCISSYCPLVTRGSTVGNAPGGVVLLRHRDKEMKGGGSGGGPGYQVVVTRKLLVPCPNVASGDGRTREEDQQTKIRGRQIKASNCIWGRYDTGHPGLHAKHTSRSDAGTG